MKIFEGILDWIDRDNLFEQLKKKPGDKDLGYVGIKECLAARGRYIEDRSRTSF